MIIELFIDKLTNYDGDIPVLWFSFMIIMSLFTIIPITIMLDIITFPVQLIIYFKEERL